MSDARLEMLEIENADLRERLARFERDFLGGDLILPIEWRLTATEQRLLGLLLTREMATKDQIMTALYREFASDEPELKIVDVFVCKIRRKMKPFGLVIYTVWGQGYSIRDPQRTEFLLRLRPSSTEPERRSA